MVVRVPVCADAPYQAIQIGSKWYVSTDYQHHQTSLTAAQSVADGGFFTYVISERDPGLANWLETTGHDKGVTMLRWQRLARELTAEDGPQVEVRSEEHTSELQSLMSISYAVFCLKKKKYKIN